MQAFCVVLNPCNITGKHGLRFKEFGLDYGNPDLVKYAERHGAEGHRVASAAELLPLLSRCLDSPGGYLVDLPVDYSENDRILNHEIKQRSREISMMLLTDPLKMGMPQWHRIL